MRNPSYVAPFLEIGAEGKENRLCDINLSSGDIIYCEIKRRDDVSRHVDARSASSIIPYFSGIVNTKHIEFRMTKNAMNIFNVGTFKKDATLDTVLNYLSKLLNCDAANIRLRHVGYNNNPGGTFKYETQLHTPLEELLSGTSQRAQSKFYCSLFVEILPFPVIDIEKGGIVCNVEWIGNQYELLLGHVEVRHAI